MPIKTIDGKLHARMDEEEEVIVEKKIEEENEGGQDKQGEEETGQANGDLAHDEGEEKGEGDMEEDDEADEGSDAVYDSADDEEQAAPALQKQPVVIGEMMGKCKFDIHVSIDDSSHLLSPMYVSKSSPLSLSLSTQQSMKQLQD